MENSRKDGLKSAVRDFWNVQSCDTQVAKATRFSLEYFEEIERFRYRDQPYIHSFAQFTRYRGKRVLEVGVGAGTDFTQWLRAGARATGVDLTPEAIANMTHRREVYDLPAPEELREADAEQLPFADQTFDLVYSFGVLHHSPDTAKAVKEAVRVTRPGGEVKLMLYNRRSIFVINQWVKHALMRGRPWRGLKWILANRVESPGTRGYTRRELKSLLASVGLDQVRIHTEPTSADWLSAIAFPPLNRFYRLLLRLAGSSFAWRPDEYVKRVNDPGGTSSTRTKREARCDGETTGNPLGFFHCITARKPR